MAAETHLSHYLFPDWDRPATVRAAVSLRWGGDSAAPFASFNLGDQVGDDPQSVARNRRRLRKELNLPCEPLWLRQVHGTDVTADEDFCRDAGPPRADGAVARRPGQVLVILSADCLPVLACSRDGQVIGAFHAGWRGLAAGILERGLAAMGLPPREILVYLAPSIGPRQYMVGPDVRAAFLAWGGWAADCFEEAGGDRYFADLPELARRRLTALGVRSVTSSGLCTAADPQRFFSYRRDGQTGRMASLIWRES